MCEAFDPDPDSDSDPDLKKIRVDLCRSVGKNGQGMGNGSL